MQNHIQFIPTRAGFAGGRSRPLVDIKSSDLPGYFRGNGPGWLVAGRALRSFELAWDDRGRWACCAWLAGFLGLTAVFASAAPSPPTALIAISGDSSVTLRWEASPGADSYTVSRRTSVDSGNYLVVANNLAETTYTQNELSNGTRYFYIVTATDGNGTSAPSNQARAVAVAPAAPGAVVWPLANSSEADSDVVRYLFGPRHIGAYDFHAGLDLNAETDTPVRAAMAGTVTNKIDWDGTTSGAGNNLLISHGNQKWSSYLHLNAFKEGVDVGTEVAAGDVIGYVGKTGASFPHLHFTYMVGLTSDQTSEMRSRSPLEILPHSGAMATASFRTDDSRIVDISMPAQQNTIRWIILKGEGITRIVDYYDVVAQGFVARKVQTQYGLYLDVAAPDAPYPAGGGILQLRVSPDPDASFVPARIIVLDFEGNTLVDQLAHTPFQLWLIANQIDPATDPLSDPDGDGVSLLMEYALDLSPQGFTPGGLPVLSVEGGDLKFTYHKARSEMFYLVETSQNMETWTTNGVVQNDSVEGQNQTAAFLMDDASQRFFRLRVSAPVLP